MDYERKIVKYKIYDIILTISINVLGKRIHLQEQSVLLEEHLIEIYNYIGNVVLDVLEAEFGSYTLCLFLRYSFVDVDWLVHDSAWICRGHFLDVYATLARSYYDGTLKSRAENYLLLGDYKGQIPFRIGKKG